jgi:hypothetical protein
MENKGVVRELIELVKDLISERDALLVENKSLSDQKRHLEAVQKWDMLRRTHRSF